MLIYFASSGVPNVISSLAVSNNLEQNIKWHVTSVRQLLGKKDKSCDVVRLDFPVGQYRHQEASSSPLYINGSRFLLSDLLNLRDISP